jgi:hypothetical protein
MFRYMCAESDDDVSPSQSRGDEAELQGIRHPQVPQSPGKTSLATWRFAQLTFYSRYIRIPFFWST